MPKDTVRWTLLPIMVVAAVGLEFLWRSLPSPADPDAAEHSFSAERAFAHIQTIASEPHPAGTEANRDVRQYLVKTLETLGIEPELQSTTVVHQTSFRGHEVVLAGHITNVLGRIDGTGPDPGTLVLMAHFDSRPITLGAADDGAGTASLLETARAIVSGPKPRNNIVFLFTDGEEPGLLGARAFFEDHPWAADADVVLNFEARGSSGVAIMFQTSALNNALLDTYARAVARPHANSLMGGVYRVMPNDTDLTPALESGKAGMNFAFIGDLFDYHSMTDSPENLSLASLQHLGEQSLAMARKLGAVELPVPQTVSRVYFDVLGRTVVSYPIWAGWIIAGVTLVGLVLLMTRSRRGLDTSWAAIGRGFAAGVVFLLGIGLFLDALSGLLTFGTPAALTQWARKAEMDLHLAVFALAAVAALFYLVNGMVRGVTRKHWGYLLVGLTILVLLGSVGPALNGSASGASAFAVGFHIGRLAVVAALCLLVLSRPLDLWALWIGNFLLLGILGGLLQFVLPESGFAIVLPLLLGLIAAHLILSRDSRFDDASSLLIIGGLGFPALVWSLHLGAFLYEGLAYAQPSQIAIALLIGGVPILPLFNQLPSPLHRLLPGITAIAGLIAAFVAFLSPNFSERHPRPTELAYLADTRSGNRLWITGLEDRDPWLGGIMAGSSEIGLFDDFGPLPRGTFFGTTAPDAAISMPDWDRETGDDGRTQLIIRPGAGSDGFYIFLKSESRLAAATLNQQPLEPPQEAGRWWSVLIAALPETPVDLTFATVDPDASVDIRYIQTRAGLPADADLPERPPDLMPLPYSRADQTIVIGQIGSD